MCHKIKFMTDIVTFICRFIGTIIHIINIDAYRKQRWNNLEAQWSSYFTALRQLFFPVEVYGYVFRQKEIYVAAMFLCGINICQSKVSRKYCILVLTLRNSGSANISGLHTNKVYEIELGNVNKCWAYYISWISTFKAP